MNNVANILKQLSFEENEEDEEEEEDRSDHHLHNDSEDDNDNNFYASDPSRAPSMTSDTAPVPSQITSVMIANAIVEPTNSQNAPTLTRNMHPADDGQHDRQSGSSIDNIGRSQENHSESDHLSIFFAHDKNKSCEWYRFKHTPGSSPHSAYRHCWCRTPFQAKACYSRHCKGQNSCVMVASLYNLLFVL